MTVGPVQVWTCWLLGLVSTSPHSRYYLQGACSSHHTIKCSLKWICIPQLKPSQLSQYLFNRCQKKEKKNLLGVDNSGQFVPSVYPWWHIQISLMWRLVELLLTVSRRKIKGICLGKAQKWEARNKQLKSQREHTVSSAVFSIVNCAVVKEETVSSISGVALCCTIVTGNDDDNGKTFFLLVIMVMMSTRKPVKLSSCYKSTIQIPYL